jgi:hypothetical protein
MGGVSAAMTAGTTVVDLSLAIVVDHLRARSAKEASIVIDAISRRLAETQRFAGARLREAVEVARRSQRLRATSDDNL